MKAKYLLTALALPALFAACSQEDIVTESQMPQSTELLGKVAGDVVFDLGPQSRLAWGATGDQTWESGDEFSLFWVNENLVRQGTTVADGLVGTANALYKTSDGVNFESNNIIYEGKHLLVYPVDKKHTTKKAVAVKADSIQDGTIALGKRSVYVSDSLLTIKAPLTGTATPEYGVVYAAGYNESVKASVKPLTSNFVLNLSFDMPENISEVVVKKVSLVADKNIFSLNGNLNVTNDSVIYAPLTDEKNYAKTVAVTMPANTKVTKTANTCTAQISLLPVAKDADYYAIEVVTNYGTVTIDSAKYVKNAKGQYLIANTTKQDGEFDFAKLDKAARVLDLGQEFDLTNDIKNEITYRGNKNVIDNSYGKRITANVTVNMSEASIENMEVATSEELIAAYETYDLLEKETVETFVLKSAKPFELTPAAVAKIMSNKKVLLTQELTGGLKADTIKLVGAHDTIPQLAITVKDAEKNDVALLNTANTFLVLGADGSWEIDVDAAAAANTWAEIINDGTLTISESNPAKNAVALTANILNRDSVAFSGDVTLPVQYKQEEVAVTYVPATADVTWAKKSTIQGLVNVSGILDVKDYKATIGAKGTVEVYGRFRNTDTGEIINLGTIKIMNENATAIITENGNGTLNGSVELINRDDLVTVTGTNKGYIKWACDVATLKKEATDVFNYIIVSENVTIDKDSKAIDHVEVDATARITTKKTAGETFESLFVNEGNTLIIPTASIVKVASKFVLDGDVEVLGSFDYSTASKTGNGDVFYQN